MSSDDERAPSLGVGPELLRSGTARSAVFQAKLRPPVNPEHLVRRPRLHALLDESVAAPLTLVVAPAGSGKTSLLCCWAAETSLPYAWLSLDEDDRDPVQLWRAMLAALAVIAPGCTPGAGALVSRPGRLLDAVGMLLDDLEVRDEGPKVLVIDDLQLVDDEAEIAVDSLALFVQHLPPWLHVVMATRHTPRLPVHRLRARGQLGEVHFPQLRFSLDEATAMLTRLVPSLEPDQVADVAVRAGGWAASIQLAALGARSAQAQGRAYLPSHDDDRILVEDYVWQEVLANEDEELVDVLVATSVVKRVDAGLAQVLAARADAFGLLARAEERGLFVSRIEPSGMFEMHALVRQAMLTMLAQRSPERLSHLHGWAAGWYEAHGQTVTALDHWLRAGSPRDALRLLAAQATALYDGGHQSTILRTIQAIPPSLLADGLDAMIEFAWCHLLVDRARFVALVDRLARTVRDDLTVDPVRGARIEVLQSIAATLEGHWTDGASLARSALQVLEEGWWLDPLGQFAWNMIARDAALAERWDDTGSEARDILQALSVVPERRIAFEGTRALAEALAGRPVDALRLAAGARQSPQVRHMSVLRTEVLAAEAVAHRELGEPSIALPMLLELAELRIEPASHCQLLALLELVHARLDQDDPDSAARAFGLAAELVDTQMRGPDARSWLARSGTVLALARGDVDAARDWATQVSDPFWAGISDARILLADEASGLATEALAAVEPRCLRHRVLTDLLQFRAAASTGSPVSTDEAERHLVDAVRAAAGHGLVQTVASEGHGVVEAVERLAWQAPPTWVDRLRRAAQPRDSAAPEATDDPVEALTERELEVLRMLPSRLTLREIADELFISINTLKFHLKVIYRKLGCSSRAEAAEMARALTSLRRTAHPSSTRRR